MVNRQKLFNDIEERLNILAYRIKTRNKINLLDLNIHSETFFADLCNIIFDLELTNLNASIQNIEGIDLVDNKNKYVVQVSSTYSKDKIENSLSKDAYKKYANYTYKFISISKSIPISLKQKTFSNPYNIKFDPSRDIWDIPYLLREISSKNIDELKAIHTLIRKELGCEQMLLK